VKQGSEAKKQRSKEAKKQRSKEAKKRITAMAVPPAEKEEGQWEKLSACPFAQTRSAGRPASSKRKGGRKRPPFPATSGAQAEACATGAR
jgi:hypothetical protein